ncbi:MAG: Crp/Fnr family transcriptional regulator [Pseudomonadota bacterium]
MTTQQPAAITGLSLSGIKIFADLSLEERESIASRCQSRRYRAGELVLAQEDPSRDVFFIISGTVRVQFLDKTGKDTLFRAQTAGEMFGELSAIDGARRSATIQAEEDCWLAFISPEDFRDTLTRHPKIALDTLEWVIGLVRELSERLHSFNVLPVKQRVRVDLLRLARLSGVANNQAMLIPPPKHADIAARVGTHREGVTRELTELQKMGLVERSTVEGRRALAVSDVDRLQQMLETVRD